MNVHHYNRPMAYFRGYPAELVFSAFGSVKIPEAYDHPLNCAKTIDCEVIKSEVHSPTGMLTHFIGNTEVFRTNNY
jgi:hypothetical protein